VKSIVQVMFVCISAALLLTSARAEAQQPVKVPRVGYLSGGSLSTLAARIDAFRQGLRELGYIEGKNIAIEWRESKGNFDRVRELADELVRLNRNCRSCLLEGTGYRRPRRDNDIHLEAH